MNLARYFRPVVYVTLEPERLAMREVGSARRISGPPLAAISREPKRRIVAVGEAAKAAPDADLFNPFKHPRTLLSDFTLAEQLVKAFLKQLFADRLFAASPIVVLHPRVDPEGGFTQIEIRALQELGIGAGASKVIVWQGRDLADEELLSLEFGSGGQVLQ